MNLVSVIIPTFNRADIVGNAIASVINQTYKFIEIIVVDDGSTSETFTAIAVFGDRVKYIYKENGGVSSARNCGIIHSSGDLIAFLDSDDTWLPEKIEVQVNYLRQHPDFGMVLTDCYFMNPEGNITGRSNRRDDLPNDGMILRNVLLSPSLVPSSVLIRKEILVAVGMFDEKLKTAEDLDLHLKIATEYKIGLICEPLFNYMRGNVGLSMLSRTYDDHVHVIERFTRICCDQIERAILKRALFKTYATAACGKYWNSEMSNGLRYLVKMSQYVSRDNIYTYFKIWAICIKYTIKRIIY